MTPPGTFERVYAALKQRLRQGMYRPGDRLEPAALSDELNASVTPVRDALHRLTGERLVDAPRHEGFRVPMLTETMLRQLYRWHLDLLLLAVANHRAGAREPTAVVAGSADRPPHERQGDLFDALARSSSNAEHTAALENLGHRLEPLRRLEAALLDDLDGEIHDILAALRSDDRKALRNALIRYHRRRERIVPELIAAILHG